MVKRDSKSTPGDKKLHSSAEGGFISLGASPFDHLEESPSGPAPTRSVSPGGVRKKLTAREIDVFRPMAGGHRNFEIAAQLGISTRTVEKHVENILRKLAIKRRHEAAGCLAELSDEEAN